MRDERMPVRAVVFLGREYVDAHNIPDRDAAIRCVLTLLDASGASLDEDAAIVFRKSLELLHAANAAMLRTEPGYMCEYPYRIDEIGHLLISDHYRAGLLRLGGDLELIRWWEENFDRRDRQRQLEIKDSIYPYIRWIDIPVAQAEGGTSDED